MLPDGIGYLKVSVLPGLLGLDVARKIDAAVAELAHCDRLILRPAGAPRWRSWGPAAHEPSDVGKKLPIGYTVTRKAAEQGYKKEELRRLDRLPTDRPNPLAVATMALKFAGRDSSVLLVSEGLPAQKWHGRAVILDQ